MKKFKAVKLITCFAMALSVFALSGCVRNSDKVLKMATNAEFPPYEYYDGEEIVGIDVEFAKAIAADMGYKLEIVDMDFGSIISAVQSGKADIAVAAMSVTEEKLQQINFSDTYATASQLIIVPEDSTISSVPDLTGKRIGVQIFTTGDVYAGDIEDATIERFNKGYEAIDALKDGRVDAVVIDSEPAKVFAEENEGLKIIDEPLTEEEYAVGVAKENTKLLNSINKSIQKLKDSGKLDKIKAKYINAD